MTHHLVGTAEIATMLGVSRARVTQLADAYEDFPAPQAELAAGRIWSRTDVERWIRSHPTRPGGRRPVHTGPDEGSFFDRFDEAARQSIALAQERARLLGHAQIGCEHLLLGLAHEPTGLAGRALASVGADVATLTDALETAAPRRKAQSQGHLPFTSHAKHALELSYRESLNLDSDSINTEHILLGILADDVNLAIQLLHEKFGITPPELRQTVLETLSDKPLISAPNVRSVGLPDILDRVDQLADRVNRRLSRIEKQLSPRPDNP